MSVWLARKIKILHQKYFDPFGYYSLTHNILLPSSDKERTCSTASTANSLQFSNLIRQFFKRAMAKKNNGNKFFSQMVKVHILEEAFLWNKFLYSQLSIFVQRYQFDMVLSCLNIGKYVAVLTTYSSDDMSKM